MLLKDAVLHLLRAKFPIRPKPGVKHEPSPEEIEYRRELEGKPLFTLIAMIESLEPTKPIPQQINTLLFEAFRGGEYFKPAAQPAVAAYRQRLEQMTEAELAQHRANVLRGRGPSHRELWEPAHFFNLPSARAELNRWALEPFWTAGEAVSLSFGREPSLVTGAAVKPYAGGSEFADEFLKRTDRFARAIEARDIATKMRPFQFIVWGRQWGVAFPDELQAAVPFPVERPLVNAVPPVAAPEADTPAPRSETPIPPMTPEQLSGVFRAPGPDGRNDDEAAWRNLCSRAKSNGLICAEAERPVGRAPRKFDVERVAAWLISDRGENEKTVALGVLRAIPLAPEFDAVRDRWERRSRLNPSR